MVARQLLFLSHAGEDSNAAQELAQRLRETGFDVWLDIEELRPGDNWSEEIGKALTRCNLFAVYIGRLSDHCFAAQEAHYAMRRARREPGFRVVPILGQGVARDRLPWYLAGLTPLDLNGGAVEPGTLMAFLSEVHGAAAESKPRFSGTPFLGLSPFEGDHAELFFGRHREVEDLLDCLRTDRFLAVVGDSGSGKSSLVRAGLVPALHRGRFHEGGAWATGWRVAVASPAGDALGSLACALPSLQPDLEPGRRGEMVERCLHALSRDEHGLLDCIGMLVRPALRTLVVVDHFEETFTHGYSQEQRRRFMDMLIRATSGGDVRPVHIVVVLRSDFRSRCLEHRALSGRVEGNHYMVGRMQRDQLRQAIEEPATLAGRAFERGVVERLLDAVKDEPGHLPLLEHALLQLWNRTEGDLLTHATYDDIGGVEGALGRHADATYDRLPPETQPTARKIFLRLTHAGQGTEDTRRRATRDEIVALNGGTGDAATVLARLEHERLVTASQQDGGEWVEAAHEALIRRWQRLRSWLDQNRDELLVERRLMAAARQWVAKVCDSGGLLRGTHLEEAERWARRHAADLTTELRAFLNASVNAHDAHEREQWRRRYVMRVVLIFAVAAALVATTSWWQARKSSERAKAALANSDLNEAGWLVKSGEAPRAFAHLARALRLRATDVVASSRAFALLVYTSAAFPVSECQHLQPVVRAEFSADGQLIVTASLDRTARVWDARTGSAVAGPLEHDGDVMAAEFSRDGTRVVTAAMDGTARVWDARTGRMLVGPLRHDAGIVSAKFSPDGGRVVTASVDRTVRVWDAGTGSALLKPLQHGAGVVYAEFSADGTRVVTSSLDGTACVWDARHGNALVQPLRHAAAVMRAKFSVDGRRIVSGSLDRTAVVWDAGTGRQLAPALRHDGGVRDVDFSPDGLRVATASWDKTARVWDTVTGTPVTRPVQHEAPVFAVEFSPDGTRFVTASWDKTAGVWDSTTGEPVIEPIRHADRLLAARFNCDGSRVVTASDDHAAHVWDVRPRAAVAASLPHEAAVTHVAFSAEGTRLVTSSDDKTARVWDVRTATATTSPLRHAAAVVDAEFSPDGRRVVTASLDQTARVWDVPTGRLILRLVGHEDGLTCASFSLDGSRVVTASLDHTARIWDVVSGREIAAPLRHADAVVSAQFSPDDGRVVTASRDKTARVWDIRQGGVATVIVRHARAVAHAQFSADGRRIVTASWDGTARVWDARTGQAVTGSLPHGEGVAYAEFSVDGNRVVTASWDATARVWDVQAGRAITQPLRHDAAVVHAEFSRDGSRILSGSWDGTLRLWDAGTGAALAAPLQQDGGVEHAAFSPDGTRIATASREGQARVWDVAMLPAGADEADLLGRLLEVFGGWRVTDSGDLVRVPERAVEIERLRAETWNALPSAPTVRSVVHWFLSDSWRRTISPYSAVAAEVGPREGRNESSELADATHSAASVSTTPSITLPSHR